MFWQHFAKVLWYFLDFVFVHQDHHHPDYSSSYDVFWAILAKNRERKENKKLIEIEKSVEIFFLQDKNIDKTTTSIIFFRKKSQVIVSNR